MNNNPNVLRKKALTTRPPYVYQPFIHHRRAADRHRCVFNFNGIVPCCWSLYGERASICIIFHLCKCGKSKKNYSSNFYFLFHSSFSKKKIFCFRTTVLFVLFRLLRDLAEGRSLSRVCFCFDLFSDIFLWIKNYFRFKVKRVGKE